LTKFKGGQLAAFFSPEVLHPGKNFVSLPDEERSIPVLPVGKIGSSGFYHKDFLPFFLLYFIF
jgi:hypothetical protein